MISAAEQTAWAEDELIPVPDLTLIRDYVEIWPDPMDCPDYPFVDFGHIQGKARLDRDEAEATLAALRDDLHPQGVILRAPTKEEAEELLQKHFRPSVPTESDGQERRIANLGFAGWRAQPGGKKIVRQIVDAVHLRGYLRKLDAEQEAAEISEAEAENQRLKRSVDEYETARGTYDRQMETLAEGDARYRQWLADKRAYAQAEDMRRNLATRHVHARQAAAELGQDEPTPLPEVMGG